MGCKFRQLKKKEEDERAVKRWERQKAQLAHQEGKEDVMLAGSKNSDHPFLNANKDSRVPASDGTC